MAPNARSIAAQIIDSVISEQRSLSTCAPELLEKLSDTRDRALAQEIAYGVLRWKLQLEQQLSGFIKRPLKKRDSIIRALLLVGSYQILHLRIPEHAAVSSTVESTRILGRSWACAMVNAVLRNVTRQRKQLLKIARETEQARYSHPAWLIREIQNQWADDQWRAILEQNNRAAPMSLRVNLGRISRKDCLEKLELQGIAAEVCKHSLSGITLKQSIHPGQLPGFAEGIFSVQDTAAQLASQLLDLKPGQRVLDACAAPGGKTANILEAEPGLDTLVAVDVTSRRIALLKDTLQRLDLLTDKVQVIQARAENIHDWWDQQPFDRILLDAPCTATGVIRRHPDIKYHRKKSDLKKIAIEQQILLSTLWPLLTKGGRLIYATCSILNLENELQLEQFLDSQTNASEVKIESMWGHEMKHGKQILPGEQGMDGFYYACITKT